MAERMINERAFLKLFPLSKGLSLSTLELMLSLSNNTKQNSHIPYILLFICLTKPPLVAQTVPS